MTDTPIVVRNLHKSFGSTEVLRGINLEVARGEVVCVIGSSGSGKSTLLQCINGLEPHDQGEILVCGEPIGWGPEHNGVRQRVPERTMTRLRRRIGMVFQQFNLFPHMTVLGNLTVAPVSVLRLEREAAITRARRLLGKVGLIHKEDAYPGQLSGGQQQRVAIARALAMDPEAMLFDEATSALDPELVGEVLAVMRGLAEDGMTMVVVTHEIGFAREVADRVVFLDRGTVLEQGPAKQVLTEPSHPRLREFLARSLSAIQNLNPRSSP
ncbi:MAG: amino acid ABC transporter ATP-binding protein [Alphaproteobacteria bacterium]|nr:amino acid ABC transporter ATP-binding protein [Alphaproteobacteria bacterium]